jgi:hypothetical protein
VPHDHDELVPDIPDAATRTAATERITAHVRTGWPHLDDPIIRFRGQFCYVALPGPRSRWLRRQAPPSPILRLRYQGHIDRWKIAIYKYSSETYTEAELPTSFGPRTGTPEQGIDHTFPLYAGPSRITD